MCLTSHWLKICNLDIILSFDLTEWYCQYQKTDSDNEIIGHCDVKHINKNKKVSFEGLDIRLALILVIMPVWPSKQLLFYIYHGQSVDIENISL